MASQITRVFKNGNSQAVRIPQEFRIEASRVEISRNARGDLVIHPLQKDRGAALVQALSDFDDGFAELLEQDRESQPELQEREPL